MKMKSFLKHSLLLLVLLTTACNSKLVPATSIPTESQTPFPTQTPFTSPTSIPPTETPFPTITPTTNLPPTGTATPTTTSQPEYLLTPRSTTIPLSTDNKLTTEMAEKGYQLFNSGSLIGPGDFGFSAFLFTNPELSPYMMGYESTWDTSYVAFYRWDGQKNELLGVQPLPELYPGSGSYPAAGAVVNWNHPYDEEQGIFVNVPVPDEKTREALNLDQFSSDINQNGMPEFTLAVEYCTISCSEPKEAVLFYEIPENHKITLLNKDLPGAIPNEILYSEDPLVFKVRDDTNNYEIFMEVASEWLYTWDGEKWVDVTSQNAHVYEDKIAATVKELKADYGQPFDDPDGLHEIMVLSLLVLYEKVGMPERGLETFLEVTDPLNWPDTSPEMLCWLHLSRANAQADYKAGRKFSMPPSLLNMGIIDQIIAPLDKEGYDLSACKEKE